MKPEAGVEVKFNKIQKSPPYPSGFALRFARIEKIRWDKKPEETDTLESLRELYKGQFKHPKEKTNPKQLGLFPRKVEFCSEPQKKEAKKGFQIEEKRYNLKRNERRIFCFL